jgi:HSP20 family protein
MTLGGRNQPPEKETAMTTLAKWNPFRELETFQNRLTTLFGRPGWPANGEQTIGTTEWTPLVDVTEDDKEYLIKAELPEVKKEDVKVTVENGTLHITGERKFEKEEKTKKYHRIERAYGTFERTFVLPEGAKGDAVTADYKDGLLTVHLPKGEQVKPKALEIKVA